jgi:hypothetical protein
MSFFASGAPLVACQEFGSNQTDVFTVGNAGQLGVCSVVGAGPWSQPLPLTENEFAPVGAGVAASQQFGLMPPQTDVFLVDVSGTLNVFFRSSTTSSWKAQTISEPRFTAPGAMLATSPQVLEDATGPTRTNVFLIDNTGALSVFFVDRGGGWLNAPISPPNVALPGGAVAASPRFPASGDAQWVDAFFVDQQGLLNVYSRSVSQPFRSPWQHAILGTAGLFPPGAAIAVARQIGAGSGGIGDQTDVFVFDNSGTLHVFYIYGKSPWLHQTIGGSGVAPPGAPLQASQRFSRTVEQTEVYFIDNNGSLSGFFVVGAGGWSPFTIASAVATPGDGLGVSRQFGSPSASNPFQTDVFVIGRDEAFRVFYAVDVNPWEPYVLPTQAAMPEQILQTGNANVCFAAGSGFLQGLEVDIVLSEDLVSQPGSANGLPTGGIGIQLNCTSAAGESEAWQQYTIIVDPELPVPALQASWENFGTHPDGTIFGNIDGRTHLIDLPDPSRVVIPAGYQLGIRLAFYRGTPYVSGAEYFVFDASHAQVAYFALDLLSQTLVGADPNAGKRVTVADLAPVQGFQLVIVGWAGAELATFTSGAGTIVYTTQTRSAIAPGATGVRKTGEGSNCTYQYVAAGEAQSFTQTFQALHL